MTEPGPATRTFGRGLWPRGAVADIAVWVFAKRRSTPMGSSMGLQGPLCRQQTRFQCSFHLRMHRAREMDGNSMRSIRSLPKKRPGDARYANSQLQSRH